MGERVDMASQPGQGTDAVRHRDETEPLLELLGEVRDDLHHLAVDIAEGVPTPQQHHQLADRLQGLRAPREP